MKVDHSYRAGSKKCELDSLCAIAYHSCDLASGERVGLQSEPVCSPTLKPCSRQLTVLKKYKMKVQLSRLH